VQRAFSRALEKYSKVATDAREAISHMNDNCLSNVITQFKNNLHVQDKGIVTGDNHSVSLCVTVHYTLEPYSLVIDKVKIFRRFTDDIVWLCFGSENTKVFRDSHSKMLSNHLAYSSR